MKSVRFKTIEGNVEHVMFRQGNGALKYEVPSFDSLYETEIKDAYTDETWKMNGSDKANYDKQMSIAKERFIQEAKQNPIIREKCTPEQLELIDSGQFPNDLTAHHAWPSGKNAKNVVMQIVDSEAHKQPHKGASAMANPKIRERDYEANYGDQSMVQNLADRVEYTVIKNPEATSVAVGGATGLISYGILRKFGISQTASMIGGTLVGLLSGIATQSVITANSQHIHIGD